MLAMPSVAASIVITLVLPYAWRVGPQRIVEESWSFIAVMLNRYSKPASRFWSTTEVDSTSFTVSGVGWVMFKPSTCFV